MAAPGVTLALDPAFLVPAMALIGALLAGAAVIALVRRWNRGGKVGVDAGAELARYRALYERGAISEQEYRSLRGVLGVELRKPGGSEKMPPAAAEAPSPTRPGLPDPPAGAVRPAD